MDSVDSKITKKGGDRFREKAYIRPMPSWSHKLTKQITLKDGRVLKQLGRRVGNPPGARRALPGEPLVRLCSPASP
jgi:hypothetical protein